MTALRRLVAGWRVRAVLGREAVAYRAAMNALTRTTTKTRETRTP